MFVVSAGDYSMGGVAEGDGENSRGICAVDYRGVGDGPCLASVGGMEYACNLSSGGEPDVAAALDGDAGSAGGECAFAFDGWRERVGRNRIPVFAAVFGRDQFKFNFARIVRNGIAECDAVIAIPERHAIEKAFGVFVGKLQGPSFARVGGFVDSRLIAGSRAQEVGKIRAEGFHITEIEGFSGRNLGGLPGIPAIGRPEIGSVSTARPGDLVCGRADAAEIFGCVGFLGAGALPEKGGGEKQEYEEMRSHAMIVPEVMDFIRAIESIF